MQLLLRTWTFDSCVFEAARDKALGDIINKFCKSKRKKLNNVLQIAIVAMIHYNLVADFNTCQTDFNRSSIYG